MFFTTARRVLLGVTLGVLLALIVAPQTRWIVNMQAHNAVRFGLMPGYGGGYRPAAELARTRMVAAEHPQDYLLQYAEAVMGGSSADSSDEVQRLRGLESQFPRNASLRANILRLVCTDEIHPGYRPEDYLLFQDPLPKQTLPPIPPTPAQLAAFDQDAVAGERLDPGNAYFPMMRAAALYVAHRDAAARASLLQVSHGTRWDDYSADEVAAMTRMHTLAFGDKSAVWKALSGDSELLPHYALLRAMARVATYQAMQEEMQGHVAQGTALRMAIIHGSELMRVGAWPLIGAFVAVAMEQMAMQRPDGMPWIATPLGQRGLEGIFIMQPDAVAARYINCLRAQGDDANAAQVMAVDRADQQTNKLVVMGDFTNSSPARPSPLVILLRRLMLLWIADLTLLANVFWVFVFWAVAAFLQKSLLGSRLREQRRLLVGGVIGLLVIAAFLAQPMCGGLRSLYGIFQLYSASPFPPEGTSAWPSVAVLTLLAAPLLLLLAGVIRLRWVPISRTIASASAFVICVLLLGYAGLTVATARQERIVSRVFTQRLHNEGQYLAAQMGQTWPGVVD